MTFGTTLGEHLKMAASANMYFILINYKSKANMKVAASNTNIKIHQMFSKQRILGVCMTILKRKISEDLTRSCF